MATMAAAAPTVLNSKPALWCSAAAFMRENAATVSVGQTLPPGCVAHTVVVPLLAGGTASVKVKCATAVADGTYPTVFNNDGPDGSFGITSPIFLDNLKTNGEQLGTLAIPSDQIVTSFSSKSELALNRSDRRQIYHLRRLSWRPGIHYRAEPAGRFQLQHAGRYRSDESSKLAILSAPWLKWMRTVTFKSLTAMLTAATMAGP